MRCDMPSRATTGRQGFEPWVRFYPDNRLAGGSVRPLRHLPRACVLAERVRFELTVRTEPHSGFQDRRLKPLGHLSLERFYYKRTANGCIHNHGQNPGWATAVPLPTLIRLRWQHRLVEG